MFQDLDTEKVIAIQFIDILRERKQQQQQQEQNTTTKKKTKKKQKKKKNTQIDLKGGSVDIKTNKNMRLCGRDLLLSHR